MSRKRNKCDKEFGISWEEGGTYDQNFAKDIFDVIDSFIDKENINESFSVKRAKKCQFRRHCLSDEKKISNKNIIYYDCENLERYSTFVDVHLLDSNYFEISTLFSLGDKEKVISAFRNFFEGNEYLKITPQCGFSFNNKALTLLLSSLDHKISSNYDGKIVNFMILIGEETYNFYPIDMNVFLEKLNDVIKKHWPNAQLLKINPDGKRRRELFDIALKKAKEIYGDIINPYIIDRLNYELDEFTRNFGLKIIYDVQGIQEYKLSQGQIFIARSFLNNSLLFYLVGICNINPMPRHHYCPKCHTFSWGEKELNKKCSCCSSLLKEDGYDLPFELLLDDFKRNGVEFSFLTNEEIRFPDFPKLHYVKTSCMELASELGLSQCEINSNEIDIITVDEVIKCLIFPKSKSEASYYSSHYKNYSFYEHLPFIGMDDLGCQLLHEAINKYFDNVKTFDHLINVMCSIHGTGVIEANSAYLSDASLENKITSSDDLYLYLLKAQLNKDDALLICRETRLCQKEYLSPLIKTKLKEVGEDDKFISFLQCVQKLFYKGQVAATARVDMLLAKIYLNDPMRYYRAFFGVNVNWVTKINDDCNFVKEYELAKYKTYRDIYLGAIDLEERGYYPKQLIKEIKSSHGLELD